MKLDKVKILSLIEEGYLMVNDHPSLPLRIYNYTRKTQFEKYWNEYTLLSRGLVLDFDYNVIAFPFKKFFNYEEHKPEEIPNMEYDVYDKMDGSLGILFNYGLNWHIVTRGSFVSDQAIKAKEILKKYDLTNMYDGFTYLFEIIYPENRIVVDYGTDEKLVLLGMINNDDGMEVPYLLMNEHNEKNGMYFPVVKRYDSASIQELKARNVLNEEGYVLKFRNGFRMKVKFEDYCRLHSVITNVSTKDVWEFMRDGRNIEELLDRTPDEFDDWVRNQLSLLKRNFERIEIYCKGLTEGIKACVGSKKKDFAEKALLFKESAILFKMLENKPYDHIIWKMVEPEFSKPFWNTNDEG